jgi:hypothetical protein
MYNWKDGRNGRGALCAARTRILRRRAGKNTIKKASAVADWAIRQVMHTALLDEVDEEDEDSSEPPPASGAANRQTCTA